MQHFSSYHKASCLYVSLYLTDITSSLLVWMRNIGPIFDVRGWRVAFTVTLSPCSLNPCIKPINLRIQSMFNLFFFSKQGAIGFHSIALSVKGWCQFVLSGHKRSLYAVAQEVFFLTVATSFYKRLGNQLDSIFVGKLLKYDALALYYSIMNNSDS